MIGTMLFNAPPVPSDQALSYSLTLLGIAADPAGTKARLGELTNQIAAVHTAIEEHAQAQKRSEEAAAALANLQEREQQLAQREADLNHEWTRMAVATAAVENRELSCKRVDESLAQRSAELAAREQTLEQRVSSFKAVLSA